MPLDFYDRSIDPLLDDVDEISFYDSYEDPHATCDMPSLRDYYPSDFVEHLNTCLRDDLPLGESRW